MKADQQQALQWLAYGYVNDELGEKQRESFELRLLEDQEAREAVAAAVELSQAMHAAVCSTPVAPAAPSAVVWRRVAAAALVVATALVVIVVLQWGPWQSGGTPQQPPLAVGPQAPQPAEPVDTADSIDSGLAEMWAMQLAETEPESPAEDRATWQEVETEDGEPAINNWMWAAVDVGGEDLDDSELEQAPEESL